MRSCGIGVAIALRNGEPSGYTVVLHTGLAPEHTYSTRHWRTELKLTNQTNRLSEFTDEVIEVLPMPTKYHQAVSKVLFLALLAVVQRISGDVFYAPLRAAVIAQPLSFS